MSQKVSKKVSQASVNMSQDDYKFFLSGHTADKLFEGNIKYLQSALRFG
jgi:hypothetical protein